MNHTKQSIRALLPRMFPDHMGGPARRRIVGNVTDTGDGALFIVRSKTRAGGQLHTLVSLSFKDGIAKTSDILICVEQATAQRMACATLYGIVVVKLLSKLVTRFPRLLTGHLEAFDDLIRHH